MFDKKCLSKYLYLNYEGKSNNYLASGPNKIELSENPNVIIWGVVTYVIHKLQ